MKSKCVKTYNSVRFFLLGGVLFALCLVHVPAKADSSLPSFTLDEVLQKVLSNNPSLGAVEHDGKASRYVEKAARGRRWPRLDAYGVYTRYSDPVAVVPIKSFGGTPPVFSKDIYATGIHGTFPLFRGGMLKADEKSAAIAREQWRHEAERLRQVLAAEASDLFYGMLYLEKVLEAQEDALKALRKTRDDAALRVELGRVPPLDLMEMDTQMAAQEQEIVTTKEEIRRTKQRLARLMGLSPGSKFMVDGTLPAEAVHREEMERWKQAIVHRPDLSKAKKEMEKAQAELLKAKGARLPAVDLVADYGRRAGSGLEGDEEVWSAGLSVTLNLFSGGALAAKVSEAREKELAAKKRYEALLLQAESEVLAARSALEEAGARLRMARKAEETAKEAFRIEKIRYRVGTGSVTDLLAAQAAWRNARARSIGALYDRVRAVTAFRLATGAILRSRPESP